MPIGQLGMMLAGAGLGQILAPINDRRQLRQQEKLQQLQMQGNKEMTDYNTRKQMEMWENTSYPAQMAMLKKAGLNPALLYGQGGGGGATTNISAANLNGADAPKGGGEIIGMGLMGQQAALIAAQTENVKADTENKKTTNPQILAQTENIKADTGNIQADTAIKEIQASIESSREAIIQATQNQAIAMAMTELRRATAEMHMQERENNINEQTKNTKIQQIRAELAGVLAENVLKQSGTAVNIERVKQIKQDVINSINQIDINATDVDIKRKLQEFETEFGKQYGAFAAILARLLSGR